MLDGNIKVLLNNNPACEAEIESTAKNQVWKMNNEPYILIEGAGFKDYTTELKVMHWGNELIREKVLVENGSFKIKVGLIEPLKNVERLDIKIGDSDFAVTIQTKKLYGTVTYFDGSPVKYPILSCTYSEIVAIGDEFGNFELLLTSPEKQIGVFDRTYSKDTLEAWLYNVNLDFDTKLDIRIDKAEVYGLTMWKQHVSDYIHFIPMSLSRGKEVMGRGFENELEVASCEDMWPKLSKENLEVYSDNKPIDILSFTEVKDFIGYKDDKAIYRNGYVISIPKEDKKRRIIKLVIKSNLDLNGEKIIDMGEGYFIMI